RARRRGVDNGRQYQMRSQAPTPRSPHAGVGRPHCRNKKDPRMAGHSWTSAETASPCEAARSLDLGFLVDHVLAGDRIEFLDLHLLRHVPLVLVGRVEVASSGRRLELDLVAHGVSPRRGCVAGWSGAYPAGPMRWMLRRLRRAGA